MAVVIGPLFSIGATGSINKTLTFKRGTRRTVARKYAKPGGSASALQTVVRVRTGQIMKHWKNVSPSNKLSWTNLADATRISRINAFMKENFKRLSAGSSMTDVFPALDEPLFPSLLLVATGPTPVPDCLGTYPYVGEFNGEHYYQRAPQNDFFIFYDSIEACWFLRLSLAGDYFLDSWQKFDSPIGIWDPDWQYTGTPESSEI